MLFSARWFKFSLLIYILISILLTIGGYYEIKNIFLLKFLNIMVGLLLSISFASYISNGKLITGTKKYFGSAFFIYLSHGLINSKIIKIFIFLINPDSDMGYITLLLLSYFSSILLLYSLYKALDRFAPRVLSVCIGRWLVMKRIGKRFFSHIILLLSDFCISLYSKEKGYGKGLFMAWWILAFADATIS